MMKIWALVLGLCAGTAQAQLTSEPLMPEQAFRFSAEMIDAQTIAVRWQIAPGYYMYRDKFSFAVEPAPVELGRFGLPPGIVKDDPTFGKVETYRNEVRMQIPVSGAGGTILLKAVSQGCADMGICYPPQKHSIQLKVPAVSASAAPSAAPLPADSRTPALSHYLWPALLGAAGLVLAIGGRKRAWKWVGFELILIAITIAVFMRYFVASALP